MKISGNFYKLNMGIAGIAAGTLMLFPKEIKAQSVISSEKQSEDVFEKVSEISPQGSTGKTILLNAPSPDIEIMGVMRTAAIVVDLSKNILYKYDEFGNAQKAYLVASGKKSSPTDEGIRVVTHIEKYPYRSAPPSTKRRKKPWDYGPRIICLETIDPQTGVKGKTGEFIHGNNNPNSLGKYASLGCIRMDNEVIKELSTQVKKGDIVILKRNSDL